MPRQVSLLSVCNVGATHIGIPVCSVKIQVLPEWNNVSLSPGSVRLEIAFNLCRQVRPRTGIITSRLVHQLIGAPDRATRSIELTLLAVLSQSKVCWNAKRGVNWSD